MQLYEELLLDDWWFSNVREHQKHLQDFLKYSCWPHPQIFRFSRSKAGPENLLFSQTPWWCLCCRCRDHTLRASTLDYPGKSVYIYYMYSEKITIWSTLFAWRQSVSSSLVRWGLEGNGPHFSTLAWKIPWTEEPGRLQSMGSRRVKYDWATSLSLFTFMHWRRKWQPTPVFLPGESQGRGNLVGCRLQGRTESDTTEVT